MQNIRKSLRRQYQRQSPVLPSANVGGEYPEVGQKFGNQEMSDVALSSSARKLKVKCADALPVVLSHRSLREMIRRWNCRSVGTNRTVGSTENFWCIAEQVRTRDHAGREVAYIGSENQGTLRACAMETD